ncbi:MAG: hypothetical protein AABY87_05970 [bacterium]
MTENQVLAPCDLTSFTLKDMTECGSALRDLGSDAESMEEAANRMTRYLYDHLISKQTGEHSCALIRFFKTHAYGRLDDELKQYARGMLGDTPEEPVMKCLTLLATAGEKPEWNCRKDSAGHQAIPLPSEQVVNQIPMIRNLIRQLGLEVNTVINPDPNLLLDMAQKTFNVFHVPNALESPFIPSQQNFVIPFGIRSVLGFGGILPMGDIFAMILFSRVFIPEQTANLFKPLSLNIKLAVLPFEERVFE